MQIYKLLLILLALAVGLQARPVFAQSNLNSYARLKEDIKRLLEENKKLEARRELLTKEYEGLKSILDESKSGFQAIEEEAFQKAYMRKRQDRNLTYMKDDLQGKNQDMLLKEGKSAYFAGELIDIDEVTSLRKLYLMDLQYQKAELEIDIKNNEFLLNQRRKEQARAINELKREIIALGEKEKGIKAKLMTLEEKGSSYPRLIPRLKQETEELEFELKAAQNQIELKQRENALLKDKKMLYIKSMESEYRSHLKERNELEQAVQDYQKELDALTRALEVVSDTQQEKKELVQSVLEFDQENQALREKIKELKEEVKIRQ